MSLMNVVRLPNMPALGWCALLAPGTYGVQLWAGDGIEVRGERFFEGAWSGPFAGAQFLEAQTFTGSGGEAEPSGLRLACPTHTLAAVYFARYASGVYCANSLELLLAFARDELLEEYPYYDLDLMTVILGLRRYQKSIPSKSSIGGIFRSLHANLFINREGRSTEQQKSRPPRFRTFQDYADFLSREVEAIATNASNSDRRFTYRLLATVSSGYDSACASALARRAGCEEAVTLASRPDGSNSDDSGEPVARSLGMTVESYDPTSYRFRTDMPEIEFISTGLGADDISFVALEQRLPGRLLLTGFHGDKVWSRDASYASPWIERGDPSGGSMENFRHRVGYYHLPVPFIGCTRQREINEISNSKEMLPWSLSGRDYDRPIPRRIVETAGVAREAFGQEKRVVALPYQTTSGQNPALERFLSETSLRSFREFVGQKARPWQRRKPLHRWLHRAYRLNERVIHSPKLLAVAGRVGVRLPHYPLVPWRYSRALSEHSDIFQWAMRIACAKRRSEMGL